MTQHPNHDKRNQVDVWWSSEKEPRNRSWFYESFAIDHTWEARPLAKLTAPSAVHAETIAVFPDIAYQEILGIGTSMEESTVYNLSQMSASKQNEVLTQLLDSDQGAGFDLIRIALGTSDFTAQTFYTYNDLEEGETDFSLERFSIQKDIDLGIVGTLKRMQEISPDLRFFASPWSPPAWMKTSGSLKKGELKSGYAYIDVLARYYRKAIQAYKEQGIELYAITVQNEPLLEIDYPSCYMSPERQRELVIALRRELEAHGLTTKIWIFDHNFSDSWAYVCPILSDEAGHAATSGIAFHDYEGEPTVMTELKSAYPDKTIHMTERSIWGVSAADRIAQYFRNWASSYNAWVTMLDSTIGKHQWVGTPDPTLLVQNAANREEYWMTPEFYLTGQFSKFIQTGAHRIESNYGSAATVTNVAFLNPDQTIVVVVINQTEDEQQFRVVCEGRQLLESLPAKSVATYRWLRV
ncbi:glycoside hydrolase family 30 beta sandwich domain-containing protein [Paenibacillus filicis]|uniref:Glycoside hydrolase family 30 beta sandwich domain-containing protein n=1 Tax=Paenibacillus filicis TaxID=669464 RepID=A0ABU9DGG4_9BACL